MKQPIVDFSGLTFPTTVYQKTDVSPGYVAVLVATEADAVALNGPVFLTAVDAVGYEWPVEQPIAHIQRTDNLDQFVPGKSVLGREVTAPVTIEAPRAGSYLTGAPPPDPPVS